MLLFTKNTKVVYNMVLSTMALNVIATLIYKNSLLLKEAPNFFVYEKNSVWTGYSIFDIRAFFRYYDFSHSI